MERSEGLLLALGDVLFEQMEGMAAMAAAPIPGMTPSSSRTHFTMADGKVWKVTVEFGDPA
jgi:hypothetical protein